VKIAFVGSRALDIGEIGDHLVRTLASLPVDTVVLLRKGRKTPAGDFESLTRYLCLNLHFDYEWCIPDEGGREAVFLRDVEMVDRADAVVAYFAPDSVMEGGTGHVVDVAMMADRPVYAYAPAAPGLVTWVGGHTPADPERAVSLPL
jgi:hypothetical protein